MDLEEKKISGEIVYNGKLLEVHKDEILCPNGNKAYREYIEKDPAAAVIAKVDGKFIFEKQFRYPFHDVLIEIPAGKCDKGEDPINTAKRELEEETGFLAKNIKFLGKCLPSVAYTSEVIHLYYASDLEKTHTHLDENEFVEVFYLTEEEVIEKIKNGEISDAKTVQAFALYLLNKESL